MIYMDNAATTMRKPDEVIEAVVGAMNSMGNAGRGAHSASLSASRVIYNTRESLADADGGIDLLMPDGTLCRVIENRPGGEHMRVYVAYGFIGTKMIYKICGWEYEGDSLPADLVCPLCRRTAADFEPVN